MAVGPSIIQTALLQVAEATKEATKLTQQLAASQASTAGAASSSAKQQVDWSKFFSKPSAFDFRTADEDIKQFKDWYWQLSQYLAAIDEGYTAELQQITDDPSKALDMGSASSETRQRGSKLHGLLASLVKNRALNVVRAVKGGDGFEALRPLVLSMRPNTQSRGLALLSAITSWPNFSMQKPLHAQVLRLEEAFDETRKSGAQIGDELKTATLLRCIGGQLKTHLNVNLADGAKYADVREQVLRWDRAQQKWSDLV